MHRFEKSGRAMQQENRLSMAVRLLVDADAINGRAMTVVRLPGKEFPHVEVWDADGRAIESRPSETAARDQDQHDRAYQDCSSRHSGGALRFRII
jgi:hypothetical protein